MAFTNATRSSQYIGNGVTVAFPTGFYFLRNSDVVVTVTSTSGVDSVKTEVTHYTLSGALSPTGGSVTMLSAPASGEKVTIDRLVPLTQETDYVSGDSFPAETHEQGLDKAMMAASQSINQSRRSFRVRGSDGEIAEMSLINSGVVGTTAGGVPKMLSGTEIQELLNLPATVIDQPTKTFADATARAAATPDFLGQVGVQLDTATIYTGTSVVAGGWAVYDFAVSAGSVGTSNLADSAVTTAKLATDAVTTVKVTDANITAAKLAADAVTTAKVLDANITTAKLADGAVTNAKVAAGAIVNISVTGYSDWRTSTAVIPTDNTIPQSTEGVELISTSYVPKGANNNAVLTVHAPVLSSANANGVFALFRGTTCIAVTVVGMSTGYYSHVCFTTAIALSGTETFSVRCGPGSTGTIGINGTTSGRLFGTYGAAGLSTVTLTIQEIKA
jgi:hypothetical protein